VYKCINKYKYIIDNMSVFILYIVKILTIKYKLVFLVFYDIYYYYYYYNNFKKPLALGLGGDHHCCFLATGVSSL
jgi:hypothetical protein